MTTLEFPSPHGPDWIARQQICRFRHCLLWRRSICCTCCCRSIMAISKKLVILSALLASVSSSPLLPPRGAYESDEIALSGPVVTGISPRPAPAGEVPLSPARPTRAQPEPEPGHDSLRLRSPQPVQTAPAQLAPRLDITPASTMPGPNIGFVQAPGCTSTLSEGRLASACYWDGTKTNYASTTTLYKSVDCHGCSNLHVIKEWYYCPNMRINGTRDVITPSTHWSTVCESSINLANRDAPPATATAADEPIITTQPDLEDIQGRNRGAREAQADIACPTTLVIQPERSAGKTLTRYSRWATTTVFLNCKGCPLYISTALAGYGPANGFTKTTTLPVGVTTTYACYP